QHLGPPHLRIGFCQASACGVNGVTVAASLGPWFECRCKGQGTPRSSIDLRPCFSLSSSVALDPSEHLPSRARDGVSESAFSVDCHSYNLSNRQPPQTKQL